MATQITQTPRFFIICIYILYVSHFITSFSPTDNYLINCGSASPEIQDSDHRTFTGDSSEKGSRFLSSGDSILVSESAPDHNLSPIYHTFRVFKRHSRYVFDVKKKGAFLIRLHFGGLNLNEFEGAVKFHVLVNGYVLLYDFTGGDVGNFVVKDYVVWVEDDKVVVSFVPATKSVGFVSGIEVISAPEDLIGDVGRFVSSEGVEVLNGLMKNGYENVYRVNVGGYKVTPFNDSLWRTWVTDDEFLKVNDGSNKFHFGGRIKYRMGGASREVGPDNVYNTARVIVSESDSIARSNITMVFSVFGGYKYLIRMHFCDIASISIGMLYFNVYVNGNLAYENLDLSLISNNMLASPFYADFVVDGDSSGVITLSVGPSNMSMPHALNAILNGVEIMKINNSFGSLDGPVSAKSIMECRPSIDISVWASVVAAMILFLVAPVFVKRRSNAVKESVAWSPLPVDDVNLKQGPVDDVNLKQGHQINVA
ncbi:hypothetical protein ACET3Z_026406 [Daucus carota]